MIIALMLFLRIIWKIILRILLWFALFSIISVIVFKFVMVPITPLMISRAVEHVFDGKTPILKKNWVAIDDMSAAMPIAAMCAEDQQFMTHHGFDFEAIQKAWKNNNKTTKKKTVKGGSTITQQVAKNVFLWQGRTYFRKALEAYFTVLIELIWSKKRIMEVYLNVIEMGDGIYGADAAARAYYNKPASKLTRGEGALIAVCFPNPRKYSPLSPNSYIYAKQKRLLRQMGYYKNIEWK